MDNKSPKQIVLVVDDTPENIMVMTSILRDQYQVKAATNGIKALSIAQSANPPDIILLDIMMPDMDGYEVCDQLKSNQVTNDIPVIFVTAMGQEEDETKGLELGAVDYITKPVSPAIVKARVKTQLSLKKNMAELRSAYDIIESQKDRMQTELNVGRDIQMAMVPKLFPESTEYSIHGILEPAREVGGDFYDAFAIDDEHLCFCVGDVSGKGVPAALFMAMAKTLIKSRASSDSSTASIVTHINDELSKDNDGCLFVTLFLCILDIHTGELITTNAGHNPPLLKHSDGLITTLKQRDGPVVAAFSDNAYSEQCVQLKQGDTLLIYTDGVTEADSPEGVFYGVDRLQQLLDGWQGKSVKELTSQIVQSTHVFEGNDRQADDITVLALSYHGQASSETEGFEIEIDNTLKNIDQVNDRFIVFARDKELPEKTVASIRMAFDELLTNIISYAYDDKDQHIIHIRVSLSSNSVLASITDDGIPFNPFHLEAPDTQSSIDEREIGGLGIHLLREMLDQVSYQRKVDRNVITIAKDIDPDQSLPKA